MARGVCYADEVQPRRPSADPRAVHPSFDTSEVIRQQITISCLNIIFGTICKVHSHTAHDSDIFTVLKIPQRIAQGAVQYYDVAHRRRPDGLIQITIYPA